MLEIRNTTNCTSELNVVVVVVGGDGGGGCIIIPRSTTQGTPVKSCRYISDEQQDDDR
jgi:hypothetical protein